MEKRYCGYVSQTAFQYQFEPRLTTKAFVFLRTIQATAP
jgi:hypothetical protein